MEHRIEHCPTTRDYRAPPGFRDTPFIYVMDSNDIPAAWIGVPMPMPDISLHGDADFLLRRVAGQWTMTNGSFQVYDANHMPFFSEPVNVAAIPGLADLVIAPQKFYPRGGRIDVGFFPFVPTTKISVTSVGFTFTTGQMAFQGVKRWEGEPARPKYRYYERHYVHRFNFDLNWIACLFDPITGAFQGFQDGRTFQVPIDDYDFELFYINLRQSSLGPIAFNGLYPTWSDPVFKMMLYDAVGTGVYSQPVNCNLIFANVSPFLFPATYPMGLSPTLVYPAGSVLKFDIYSLLLLADIQPTAPQMEIEFVGALRVPCGS